MKGMSPFGAEEKLVPCYRLIFPVVITVPLDEGATSAGLEAAGFTLSRFSHDDTVLQRPEVEE
ncbi:MAG TPA: hypothetical protein VMD98_13500 [Bryocella sp.]|nr:hypothetical protein [Bryocella sp.]